MNTQLRLVADNPHVVSRDRADGTALRQLAERLILAVRVGGAEAARRAAASERLSPIGIAAVAAWMVRAGVSEREILRVIA